MKKILLATLLLAASSANAAIINYADFSDTTGLSLNGSTTVINNALRLTGNGSSDGGSVFTSNAISLLNNSSFAASFSFRIFDNSSGGDSDGGGADGLAFVVQTQNANVGAVGGGLGYQGITNSVAIEFDTYNNGSGDNNNGNHVGIALGGNVNTSTRLQVEPNRFNDDNIWDVVVTYDGLTELLSVTWSTSDILNSGGSLSTNVDVASVLGGSNAFLGFTAATGGFASRHEIISASFSNTSTLNEVSSPSILGFLLVGFGMMLSRKIKSN